MQFFGQNAHFAISLVAALAAFAVFWLTFDAWLERRRRIEAIKWVGFGLLAVGFLVSAATLDQRSLIPGILAAQVAGFAFALRILAYALIALGQILDPLQARPQSEPIEATPPNPKSTPKHAAGLGMVVSGIKVALLTLLPLLVAGLYLRRATVGLERHLRPVAVAFAWLGTYELFSGALAWQDTANPLLYRLVAAYGPLWWIAQAALLIGAVVLGRWVWQYLTKRLFSQLFIVLVTSTVLIFFISTVGFSFLLMRNMNTEALSELSTSSRVLNYAVASRQAEAAAQAEVVSQNSAVIQAVVSRDRPALAATLTDYLSAHQLSSLVITDGSGQVLLRAEDPARWGDSLSSDSLVRRALIGESTQSVTSRAGVVAPSVALVAARPLRDSGGAIIGMVIAGRAVGNSFVDGIKSATGLDSAVYGSDIRAATTLVAADGVTREVGIRETTAAVRKTVLAQGKAYSGSTQFQHRDYLAAYSPLKDADGNPVAMVLVARTQDQLLAVAGQTIQLTFLMAVLLLIVSILPIYLIARRLAGQMR